MSAKEIRERRAAEKKYLIQTGQIRPTLKSTSELHQSIVVPKWRTEVDLSKHLIEQVKPVVYLDKEVQTDKIKTPPPSPPFQPRKMGKDAGTQVQNNLVFNFDTEAEALAELLITATFDQALIEVREDETLKNYEAVKLRLERKQAEHQKEMNKRVEAERDLSYRKARMAREAQATAAKEAAVREMFAAHAVSQRFLVKLQEDTMNGLVRDGYLCDPQEAAVTFTFMPWLEEQVRNRLETMRGCATALDELIAVGIAKASESAREVRTAREAAQRQQEISAERAAIIADRKRKERALYRISVYSEYAQRPLGPIEVLGSSQVSDVLKALLSLLLGDSETQDLELDSQDGQPLDEREKRRRDLAAEKQKRKREREESRFHLALDRRSTFSDTARSDWTLEDAEKYAAALIARIQSRKTAKAVLSSIPRSSEGGEQDGSSVEAAIEQPEADGESAAVSTPVTPATLTLTTAARDEVEDDEDDEYDDFDPKLLLGPDGILPRSARLCDLPIDPSTQLKLIVLPLPPLSPEEQQSLALDLEDELLGEEAEGDAVAALGDGTADEIGVQGQDHGLEEDEYDPEGDVEVDGEPQDEDSERNQNL